MREKKFKLMSLQNMTYKYETMKMEEKGESHENIVAMLEATDPTMVEVSL